MHFTTMVMISEQKARSGPAASQSNGIEKVIDIKLNKEEKIMFDKSVEAVNGLIAACKNIDSSLK